jgi:hypothetical protein
MMPYVVWAIEAYLLIGLVAVFIGPCGTKLRHEIRDARMSPQATFLKIVAFGVLLALAIVLAWPILIPSALDNIRRERQQPKSLLDALQEIPGFQTQRDIYSEMQEDATLEPTEDGVLPGAIGPFGASPQNPIPVRTIMAS